MIDDYVDDMGNNLTNAISNNFFKLFLHIITEFKKAHVNNLFTNDNNPCHNSKIFNPN